MSSKISIWRRVPGITGRYNDIIYSHPPSSSNQDVLFYFGGDVQDIQENMEHHADGKKYIEWSLENTARILQNNFPKKHIIVVRPSRIHVTRNAMYSCFDNFVPSNEYGVPLFLPIHNALKHLQQLLKSWLDRIRLTDKSEDLNCPSVNNVKLTLIGFSKGCVVLNQLLHEFHYYENKANHEPEIHSFINSIDSMWWLDGGHGGSKDTWITEKSILESFAKLRKNVQVHVTPYQVQDSYRPWIREEESQFCNILQSMGIAVEQTLHFATKSRSLENHFNVLKAIGSYT